MSIIDEMVAELEKLMINGKIIDEFNRSGKGELFILKYLFEKNAPALPSELSEALQSSNARISAALKTLEKKGQIHREIDISNRRFILVTLTDAGRKRIDFMLKQWRGHMAQVVTELGEQDAREFIRLAGRFFEIAQNILPGISEFESAIECKPYKF